MNRQTSISGSFRHNAINASFRSTRSVRSESTAGGYETADEGPPNVGVCEGDIERVMEIINQVEGKQEALDDRSLSSHQSWKQKVGDRIDRIKFRPHFRRPKLGNGFFANCFRRYPRIYACTCGIILPLWALVFLSLLCGKFLGDFEYKIELDSNDAAMRRRQMLKSYNGVVEDTIHNLPTLCYILYTNGTRVDMLDDALQQVLEEQETIGDWIGTQPNLTGHTIVNVTRFSNFMTQCGLQAENYTSTMQEHWFGNISVDPTGDTSLSFNWNRCMNRNRSDISNRIVVPTNEDIALSQPAKQEEVYKQTWIENFNTLRQEYLEEEIATNGTLDNSRLRAFSRSLMDATGRDKCVTNVAASGNQWSFLLALRRVELFSSFVLIALSLFPRLVLVHNHDNGW